MYLPIRIWIRTRPLRDMYSSDDEIWDEAIGYEEVPQQAIDYAEKNNLVKIIYS